MTTRPSTTPDHVGSYAGYVHGRCRCGECTRASTRYRAELRARRLAERVRRDDRWYAVATRVQHGTFGAYNNWGCRCGACTDANAAYRRDYRRRTGRR